MIIFKLIGILLMANSLFNQSGGNFLAGAFFYAVGHILTKAIAREKILFPHNQ